MADAKRHANRAGGRTFCNARGWQIYRLLPHQGVLALFCGSPMGAARCVLLKNLVLNGTSRCGQQSLRGVKPRSTKETPDYVRLLSAPVDSIRKV
jgi:hypothetical protein